MSRRGHSRGRSPPPAGWPLPFLPSPLAGGGAPPDWPHPLPPFGMMNPAMHQAMMAAAMHQAAAAAAAAAELDRRRGDDHGGRDRDRDRERERAERFSSPNASDRDRAPLSAERPPRDRVDRDRDAPRSSPPPSNGQPPPPPSVKRDPEADLRREKRAREHAESSHVAHAPSSSRSVVTPGHRPPSDRPSDCAVDRTVPAGASAPDSAERRRGEHDRHHRDGPRDHDDAGRHPGREHRDHREHRSSHHRSEREPIQQQPIPPPPAAAAAAASDYPASQDPSLVTPSKHDRPRRHRSRSHERSAEHRRYSREHADAMADVPAEPANDAAPVSVHRHDSSSLSSHRHHSSSSRHHSSHSRPHGSSSKHRSNREAESDELPEPMQAPVPAAAAAAAALDHKRSRSRSRDTSASRKRARSRSPQHQRHPRDYSPPPHFQHPPPPPFAHEPHESPRAVPGDRPSHHAPYPPHPFHDSMPARHPEPMRHPSESMRHQQPPPLPMPMQPLPPPQHEPLSRYPSSRVTPQERPRVEPAPRPSRPDPRPMSGPPDHRPMDRDRLPPPQDFRDPYLERQLSEGRFNELHPSSSSGMAMEEMPLPLPPFAAFRAQQPPFAPPMPHVPSAMPMRPLERQSSMEPPRADSIDLTADRRRSSHPHRPADLNMHASSSNALPPVMSPPFSRAVSEPHPQSQAQFDRMHGTPRGPTPPQNERSTSATSVQTPHTPNPVQRPAFPSGPSGSGSSRAGPPPSTPSFSRSQTLQIPSSPALTSSVSATATPGIFSSASSLTSSAPLISVLGPSWTPDHSAADKSLSFDLPPVSKAPFHAALSELENKLMALMTQQRQAQMDVMRAEIIAAASARDLNTALNEITRVEAICK